MFLWKRKARALCVAEIELIKSTARKRGTEETHLKTIQKRNNGNPKRIWLQWHSNGNIGKAHPLSFAFLILFLYFLPALLLQSDPVVGRGVGWGGGTRRVQHKPTVLPTMPTQDWSGPGVHRKLQVVLGHSRPPPPPPIHHFLFLFLPQPISTGFRS